MTVTLPKIRPTHPAILREKLGIPKDAPRMVGLDEMILDDLEPGWRHDLHPSHPEYREAAVAQPTTPSPGK